MADNAQQAAARRALAARGNQLAPRVDSATGQTTPLTGQVVKTPAPSPTRVNPTGEVENDRGGRQGRAPRPRATPSVPKPFRSTSRALVAEFVLALVLVALKPSEPAGTGTAAASESTVPQLVATMAVFMLLAALGTAGPRPQRWANLFGGLVVAVLLFKNHGSVTTAITSVTSYTAPATPAGAPSAVSSAATATLPGASVAASGWRGVSSPVPTPNGQPSIASQFTGQ
jgi:hypothetical protein